MAKSCIFFTTNSGVQGRNGLGSSANRGTVASELSCDTFGTLNGLSRRRSRFKSPAFPTLNRSRSNSTDFPRLDLRSSQLVPRESRADTLIGGLGNDIYAVDNVGDVVTEKAGEGTDTVKSSVTYTLSAMSRT